MVWINIPEWNREDLENKSLCDLGCGSGNDAIWFVQNKFNVTAVDVSSAMIDIAKEKSKAACDVRESSNIIGNIRAGTNINLKMPSLQNSEI